MLEAWLLCKIDKGMFPGELGINFGDVADQDVSLYSSEKFVDKEKSSLLVTILEKSDKSAWVRLPGQSFNGTSVVEVPIANLKDVSQVA
jgi:hypothetical protein